MSGVRLHHKTARNAVCTVTDNTRTFPTPQACPPCGGFHTYKTHHLRVDGVGDVTVHEEIVAWLRENRILDDGWEVLDSDRYPETLLVGPGVASRPTVTQEEASWP